MANRIRLALIQLLCKQSRDQNLQRAEEFINKAVKHGADMVVLPEFFTTELHPPIIMNNREEIPGPTTELMSNLAKKHGIHLVAGKNLKEDMSIYRKVGEVSFAKLAFPGSARFIQKKQVSSSVIGSIPEAIKGDRIYNTCNVFDPSGKIIAQHRKMHMFDVKLGPHLNISESELSDSGNKLTTFHTGKCKVGIGICIDIRYPEVSRLYTERGCQLQLFMGAFSALKTGPAHWEVLQRTRAIDNQVFIATCAPARDDSAHYASWGHSMVVDPWGKVISTAGEEEGIIYAELDLDYIDVVKNQLPIENIRRKDLYKINYMGE